MEKIKILNGLPLGALPSGAMALLGEITEEDAKRIAEINEVESFVGHESTAKILTQKFGKSIAFNRSSAEVKKGDKILVCSLSGPRLPEGKILSEEELRQYKFRYFIASIH